MAMLGGRKAVRPGGDVESRPNDEVRRPSGDHLHAGDRATAKVDGPEPDDPRKPDSPTALTKRSWVYVLKKTVREFLKDHCTDLAAALTYFAVFAVAPSALALVSLLGVFGDADVIVDRVMEMARDVAPGLDI